MFVLTGMAFDFESPARNFYIDTRIIKVDSTYQFLMERTTFNKQFLSLSIDLRYIPGLLNRIAALLAENNVSCTKFQASLNSMRLVLQNEVGRKSPFWNTFAQSRYFNSASVGVYYNEFQNKGYIHLIKKNFNDKTKKVDRMSFSVDDVSEIAIRACKAYINKKLNADFFLFAVNSCIKQTKTIADGTVDEQSS